MSNPVFNKLEKQWKQPTPNAPGATQGVPTYDQRAFQAAQAAYQAPSADAVDTGRMTYDDVIVKTTLSLVTAFLFAAVSWWVTAANPELGGVLMTVGIIAGLVLAMVNIFSKKIRPLAVLAYSALEGVALGALSYLVNAYLPGVVLQAVVATFAVFAVTLALFASGKVRNSPKLQRFALISLLGLIFSRLFIWMFGLIGLPISGVGDVTVLGIPLAVFVSVFAVVIGAICLISDFDQVRVGVERGVPAKYAWASAFGIMVTLIWLYVEILNILSRMNSR